MKKLFTLSLILVFTTITPDSHAATELHKGYIITNDNDTIHGSIEYRKDEQNAQSCLFMAEGDSVFHNFTTEDIKAYRFTDFGSYYVRKTFEVEGKPQTFFAEFMMQGNISLYHLKQDGNDYYFFVDPDNKLAVVKNDHVKYKYKSEELEAKRKALRDASQIFKRDGDIVNELWHKDISSKSFLETTRHYNEKYCRDGEECIQFQYDEKKTRAIIEHFRFEVGINVLSIDCGRIPNIVISPTEKYRVDMNTRGVGVQIGAGCDLQYPRFNRHLSQQLFINCYYYNGSKKNDLDIKQKVFCISGRFGAAYSFLPENKISPLIQGGITISQMLSMDTKISNSHREISYDNSFGAGFGFYLGAGIEFPIGKHKGQVTANYDYVKYTNSPDHPDDKMKTSAFLLKFAYIL